MNYFSIVQEQSKKHIWVVDAQDLEQCEMKNSSNHHCICWVGNKTPDRELLTILWNTCGGVFIFGGTNSSAWEDMMDAIIVETQGYELRTPYPTTISCGVESPHDPVFLSQAFLFERDGEEKYYFFMLDETNGTIQDMQDAITGFFAAF